MLKESPVMPRKRRPEVPSQLLTTRSVAAMLGIAMSTVKRMGADGRLPPPIRAGRILRWRLSDIEKFINGQ